LIFIKFYYYSFEAFAGCTKNRDGPHAAFGPKFAHPWAKGHGEGN